MKRTNRTLWAAFAIIGAALAVSALALPAGMGHGPGHMGDNAAATRGLSADQVQQLDRIRADLDQRTRPLERQLEAKRMELEAVLASPDSDLDRARQLRSEIRELESQLDDAWFQARAQVTKILTPEQRAQEPDPSWWLMGNGSWYDGWSCPWDRAMASRWNRGGWPGHTWNCPDHAMHSRYSGRWSRGSMNTCW